MTVESLAKIKSTDKPKWEAIKDHICIQIRDGKYCPGELVPSENSLVKVTGFARNTIRQAISELEKDGIVEKIKGKGTFVRKASGGGLTKKTSIISLVFANLYGDFPAAIMTGAEAAIRGGGYKTQIYVSNDDYRLEREHIEGILAEGTSGIIVFGVCRKTVNPNCDIFLEVKKRGIPIVMVDTFLPNLDIDHVVSADFDGSYALAEYFIKQGHREIGYIRPPEDVTSVHARFSGFQKAMSDNDLPVKSKNVFAAEILSEHNDFCSKKAFEALFEYAKGLVGDMPSAFLCYTDGMAMCFYRVLLELGIKVPQQVAIGGFGGDSSSAMSLMPIITVSQPKYELGEKAAQLILEKLSVPHLSDRHSKHILLPAKLVVKSTNGA